MREAVTIAMLLFVLGLVSLSVKPAAQLAAMVTP